MDKKQLLESMSQIDDQFLELTEKEMKTKKTKPLWVKVAAAAACACVLVGAALVPWDKIAFNPPTGETKEETALPQDSEPTSEELTQDGAQAQNPESENNSSQNPLAPYLIAEAKYPEVPQHPDRAAYSNEEFVELLEFWWNDYHSKRLEDSSINALSSFFQKTIPEILSGTDGENKVYSPVNVYMALSMLAETTDGSSRTQILNLLGQSDITELRAQVSALWNATYRNDGYVTTLLANSFWLKDSISYEEETFKTLADSYYASSFSGEMGSEDYNLAYQNWLNEQTDGLLKNQIQSLELSPETMLSLASTIYYSACWSEKFNPEKNITDTFYTPQGEISTEFMNYKTLEFYLRGEHFGAISWDFDQAGNMWFLLPDEGYTPEDILSEESTLNFLINSENCLERTNVELTLSVPKFDISSQLELKDSLVNLGITDVFDLETSDFTPATEETEMYLSEVLHGARVKIDEEGCIGVAYTTETMYGAAPPSGKIDFILNRPFIFCITSDDNLPLFVGIVNNP